MAVNSPKDILVGKSIYTCSVIAGHIFIKAGREEVSGVKQKILCSVYAEKHTA
ncbi:MAG: hypothetical protein LBL67_03965 [Coriobacteriales bacterium]|jgi:hypothetical protein|nr:hypothetical protein [Coriobacteriales bacterium]